MTTSLILLILLLSGTLVKCVELACEAYELSGLTPLNGMYLPFAQCNGNYRYKHRQTAYFLYYMTDVGDGSPGWGLSQDSKCGTETLMARASSDAMYPDGVDPNAWQVLDQTQSWTNNSGAISISCYSGCDKLEIDGASIQVWINGIYDRRPVICPGAESHSVYMQSATIHGDIWLYYFPLINAWLFNNESCTGFALAMSTSHANPFGPEYITDDDWDEYDFYNDVMDNTTSLSISCFTPVPSSTLPSSTASSDTPSTQQCDTNDVANCDSFLLNWGPPSVNGRYVIETVKCSGRPAFMQEEAAGGKPLHIYYSGNSWKIGQIPCDNKAFAITAEDGQECWPKQVSEWLDNSNISLMCSGGKNGGIKREVDFLLLIAVCVTGMLA